ncbi:MAG: mercuric transporter MerT family protein [bacterium]
MKEEKNHKKSEIKKGVTAGFWSGILASLCCIGPLVIILFGLASVSFALSLSQYRPYFLGLGFLFMIGTIVLHLKKKNKTCDINCFSVKGLKKERKFIISVVLSMGTIYVLALYVLVPAISPVIYRSATSKTNLDLPPKLQKYIENKREPTNEDLALGNYRQLDLKINGLSCAGCAYGAEYIFKQLNGVVKAKVYYPEGTGLVIYDPMKITKEDIVKASGVYPATIVDDKSFNQQIDVEKEEQLELIDEDVHEFNITAFQWGYEPSTIKVHKSGRVVLYLTSRDVTHGFAIPEYDIAVKIEPGKTTPISFIANKEGKFTFYCSIFCGSGHSQMKGKFVVK